MMSKNRAVLVARVYEVDLSDLLPDQRSVAQARLHGCAAAMSGRLAAFDAGARVLVQVPAGLADTLARGAITDALKRWDLTQTSAPACVCEDVHEDQPCTYPKCREPFVPLEGKSIDTINREHAVTAAASTSAHAICTWGEGPDVMVVIKKENASGFGLMTPHGEEAGSFGLNVDEARTLKAQLEGAATQAEKIAADYHAHQLRDSKESP